MDNATANVFGVPSWNVDRLRNEINKLNRKAGRLGCPPVELVELGTYQRPDPVILQQYQDGLSLLTYEEIPKNTIHKFELKGEPIKLAGWTFVGSLDHVSLPGSVIVNTVPDQVVPEEFFHAEPICNHCGTARHRNDTFILHHNDGGYTQVGRQCLRDFLGHDPTAVIRYLATIWKFSSSLKDEDSWFSGGGQEHWTFLHAHILETTMAVVRTFGWVPRSVEKTGGATADKVLVLMTPTRDTEAKKELVRQIKWDPENDKIEAENAIEWLKTQPDNNEYFHNLHRILQAEAVPTNLFGYWCSLIAAYQKAQERLQLAKREQKVSEWVGNLKEKIETNVTVVGINYITGMYGSTAIHRMLDDNGRTLVWFASSRTSMEQGGKYKIVGTVKKHDEFKDWKQTILTRVRILETLTV